MNIKQVGLFLWLGCINSIVSTDVWKSFRLSLYGVIGPEPFGIFFKDIRKGVASIYDTLILLTF